MAQPLRKQKQKESRSLLAPNGAERLKTVVRRLPPNLPEEIFWQSVQAWVTDDTVTWKSYYPGKFRTKRMNKEGIPSRAYIAFKNEAQVATFSRDYDGHVFRDKAGNESQAIVEFAPFQKVPTEKKKMDARNNTIEKDDDYLSFLESLKRARKTESVSLEALIAASQLPPPPTTTPLLEALKAEKSAQKDKETILRNHAHYKDAGVLGATSKREDAKKKVAVARIAKPSEPSSKKAKKSTAHKAPAPEGPETAGPNVPSPAKPPLSASTTRHRPPRESHGRTHPGKSDMPAQLSVSTASGTGPASKPGPVSPAPVAMEYALPVSPGVLVPGQAQRKTRPVIGLGRHFEAALNSAGVAASPGPGGDRKKRDKGGEMTEGGGGKGRHREDGPVAVVPSILQRPEAGVGAPDVVIMQRPHSPKADGSGHGPGESGAGAGAGPVRGGARRGRGRGRGGNRGG